MMNARLLHDYFGKMRLFGRNARLYLLYLLIDGIAIGVFSLLFNFYILDLGYDELVVGQLLTANSTALLLGALPAGYVSDRLGRKRALLLAGVIIIAATVGLVLWHEVAGLYVLFILLGLAQSLSSVTLAPFVIENSGEEERNYLFSFAFGVHMLAVTGGYWLGGRLPAWLESAIVDAAGGYAWAMVVVALLLTVALLPLVLLRGTDPPPAAKEDPLAPFRYAAARPRLMGKFITPILITTIGAGLFVPFMNIFYRETYGIADAAIGSLFAAGSLVMAVGLFAAPPLADRYGNVPLVIATQALSIPFMALLGFAPWFWLSAGAYLARLILMNMTVPVYQAFVMEQTDETARATVSALLSMGYSFGYALSPAISGRLQISFGFGPIFIVAIALYTVAVYLYWRFFAAGAPGGDVTPTPQI